MEDGPYWLHGLGDKSKYLGEELLNIIRTKVTTDGDSDLESGHWCVIKANALGEQRN